MENYSRKLGLNDKGFDKRLPVAEGGGEKFGDVFEDGTPNDIYLDLFSIRQNSFARGERCLFDASYVKLREVVLSYSIPKNIASKVRLQGADIYFSGHTHRKGIAQQAVNTVEGGKLATYVSVGPYKPGDGWLSKMGYPEQATDELIGASLFLSNERKQVDTSWNILEAHEQFVDWRSKI